MAVWQQGKDAAFETVNTVVDTVLPPQSLLELDDPESKRLWENVTMLDAPWCNRCGFPFDYAVQDGADCGRCLARPPAYHHARAAFRYDDGSRALILSFKHGGRTEGLGTFVAQMRRAGREILSGADLIVPVPLHPTRLISRRYNQSAILARRLAKLSQVRFEPDLLRRHKKTTTQGGKSASARRRNVGGAFSIAERLADRAQDAHIILVDDVMTTGATLESCARTLKRAGARRVDALCLARVVRPGAIE